jgi:hypothetical protein
MNRYKHRKPLQGLGAIGTNIAPIAIHIKNTLLPMCFAILAIN